MPEFKAIETQEQLDAIINERIETERTSFEEKYKGYMSSEEFETKKTEYETQIGSLNASIKEKDTKIAAYETERTKIKVAKEYGMPYESAEFLKGTNEKEIKESADRLKGLVGNSKRVPPLAGTEVKSNNETRAGLAKLLKGLKGEE